GSCKIIIEKGNIKAKTKAKSILDIGPARETKV
ncbi:unnamed protein product, partial [marine sediment metagenome]